MSNKRFRLSLILVVVGGLLILGAAILILLQSSQPVPISTALSEADIPQDGIPRVRVGDAKAAYDLKSAVFVDVRGDEYYQRQHIPGALSIPLNELEARLDELNPDDWIITYCT